VNLQKLENRVPVWIALVVLALVSIVALSRFGDSERRPLTYAESRSHLRSLLNVEWPTAFGSDDEGRWLLQGGFLHPESDGTWLKEGTGSLLLDLKNTGEATYLYLDLIPALNVSGSAPRLRIQSSFETRFFQLASSGSTARLRVTPHGLEEIKISCAWPRLGRNYGAQSDLRNLCAKLHRARIDGS